MITVDDVTGNMSGPNIDIRSMSSCVPCRRQRVESAGVRCIGQGTVIRSVGAGTDDI